MPTKTTAAPAAKKTTSPGTKRKTKRSKEESTAPKGPTIAEWDLSDFASSLDLARTFWRKYPELVEAADFPEPFLSACSVVGCGIAGEDTLLEAGILKARQPKKRLTIHEIRRIRLDHDTDFDKEVAAAFTLEEADEGELAWLGVCQTLYRRHVELPDNAAPLEALIDRLIFVASYSFVPLEQVREILEDNSRLWDERHEIASAVQEEDREEVDLKELRKKHYPHNQQHEVSQKEAV